MDVNTAREIATALLVIGVTGSASMTLYGVALRSFDVDLLPTTTSARVRWWRGHLVAAFGVSVVLLLAGLTGLLLL